MSIRVLMLAMSLVFILNPLSYALAQSSTSTETADQQATELFILTAEQDIDFDDTQNCAIFSNFLTKNSTKLSDHNYNRITFRLSRSKCSKSKQQNKSITFAYLKASPLDKNAAKKPIARIIKKQAATPIIVSMKPLESEPVAPPKTQKTSIITPKVLPKNDNTTLSAPSAIAPNNPPDTKEEPVAKKSQTSKATTRLRIVNVEKYGALALRDSPPYGKKIQEVPYGTTDLAVTTCQLVKADSPRPWCKVSYNEVSGWAYSKFLEDQTTGKQPSVGNFLVAGLPATTPTSATPVTKIIAKPVELFEDLPMLNRPILGTVVSLITQQQPKANLIECVTMQSNQAVWCYLNHNGNVGWVDAAELKKRLPKADLSPSITKSKTAATRPTKAVNTYTISGASHLNVRSAPRRGRVKTKLPIGTKGIDIVSCNPKGMRKYAWCLIDTGQITGWAYARYLVNERSGMPPS